MTLPRPLAAALALTLLAAPALAQEAKRPTPAEVLKAAPAEHWRVPEPENLLYMTLPGGRVVIELAPQFAPNHVANIRALAREGWYEGVMVVRVQDNYVTQWGWPEDRGEKPAKVGKLSLPPEFTVKGGAKSLPFHKLPDPDAYAPEVGAVGSFPAARDPASGEAWMAHCYGIVGVGRGLPLDSGSGAELYVVIGHSPRALDRVITLAGRVLKGMEHLAALPRGTGNLGFYEKPEQQAPITAVRLGSDVAEAEREPLQVLRSDSPTYAAWVEARRQRKDDFFILPSGRIDVCNAMPPVRRPPGS